MIDPNVSRAWGVCAFCALPVTLNDGWLELYAQTFDGDLLYPGNGAPVALYAHARCGPDCGYSIELRRCRDVHAKHGWLDQIRGKRWASRVYLNAVCDASAFVLRAERKVARKAAARRVARRVAPVGGFAVPPPPPPRD